MLVISFDIDGTLGKETCQINDMNIANMDNNHVINIDDDKFVFYKGIVELLQKVNELSLKHNIHIMLSTAGFRDPGSSNDRNVLIINYVNKILKRTKNNLIPLYDVSYQTFHPDDIELALSGGFDDGTVGGKEWQKWFDELFKIYSVDELHIADKNIPGFKHYFYRDHQVILSKHPELYKGITLDRIIHIDDSPKSIQTLNDDNIGVKLITVNRNHPEKIKECQEVFSIIEKFVNEMLDK